MGFDASNSKFAEATAAILLGRRESRWERKVEVYKKWGWSEEELLTAFKLDPRCMFLSLDKIAASMEFFVGDMGLEPGELAKSPTVLLYSLKRVRLRCSVLRALSSRGLIKSPVRVWALGCCTEKMFLKRFVAPYVKEVPELLDLYKGKRE